MIIVGDEVVAFLAQTLGVNPTARATGIGFVGGGRVVAGVMYDKWSGSCIEAHIWIKEGRIPPLQWAAAVLDYPFNQLGCDMMVAWVRETNEKSLWLCGKLGFKEEGRVDEFFLSGESCKILKLTREDCWALRSERWLKKVPRNETSRVRTGVDPEDMSRDRIHPRSDGTEHILHRRE